MYDYEKLIMMMMILYVRLCTRDVMITEINMRLLLMCCVGDDEDECDFHDALLVMLNW